MNKDFQPYADIAPGSFYSAMLHDPARPAWFRVLMSRDMVTAQMGGLTHGGLRECCARCCGVAGLRRA